MDFSASGLHFQRRFTSSEVPVFELFTFEKRDSKITTPDGNVIFEMKDIEVPSGWSQLATDVLAQKYFRKSGVPLSHGRNGMEYSVKQVVHRLASTWRNQGLRYHYFATQKDADIFYDESVYMMLAQKVAPNSPQWFNTGLFDVYGISGPPQGHYFIDPETELVTRSTSAYERPQPHACFILSVKDDLVNPGGIMDLFLREARVFKYGSGAGTNYSVIRSRHERLSGGGTSSGLMSFLKVGDAAAGAIRSGGTTRRAAKMCCLDIDHPEIISFIRWKALEERKAQALIEQGYDGGMEGEAYASVSGQHSNNSVRITDEFFYQLEKDGKWKLTSRTDSNTVTYVNASQIWEELSCAAWECGDPGVQFDTAINDWHTCPNGGRILASNPCSEYHFLDDTACNLASLNLMGFVKSSGSFDVEGFEYACRLWTVILEISVLMAQYPSEEVASRSYNYRTIGLGYTNLGALFMSNLIAYDSESARELAASITALMTGVAYRTSAEMAGVVGPFKCYAENEVEMTRVLTKHQVELDKLNQTISTKNIKGDLDIDLLTIKKLATAAWKDALVSGEKNGFRNAQVTVIAPTGTIALLMDCDTTGIEPEFSLVKEKQMYGGEKVRIINRQVLMALKKMNWTAEQIEKARNYLMDHGSLVGAPGITSSLLKVFECSWSDSPNSKDSISVEGHLKMMAAVQPFISGGISKTVNLPKNATISDVGGCFHAAWKYGLKSISIYRDGCKVAQPVVAVGKRLTPHAVVRTHHDTPVCVDCGYATERAGTCFKCPNCGSTTGCS